MRQKNICDVLKLATKEELIWWIKKNEFSFSRELKDFYHDLMFRRHDEYQTKALKASEEWNVALSEYQRLIGPYIGKPLSSVPRDLLNKAADLERKMEALSKEEQRLWKLADKCLGSAIK